MTNNKIYELIGEVTEKKRDKVYNKKSPHYGNIYEDTNYIHKKTKDGLNLFRLLGALECLPVQQIKSINVLAVKKLTKQLLAGIKKLTEIEYKQGRGKGWMYKNKRVSIHQLEAYLVYLIWKKRSLISTSWM